MVKISYIVDIIFEIFYLILILGILMSWIPNIPRYKEPFKTISSVCEVFFAPFRRIIPPIGGLDFSPILAFLALGVISRVVMEILIKFNL